MGDGDCEQRHWKSLASEGSVEIVLALVLPLDMNCVCWQLLLKVCEEKDIGDDGSFWARTSQNEIFLSFT